MSMRNISELSFTDATAVALSNGVRSGDFTAAEVITSHLEKISDTNPTVNALLDIQSDRALAEASRIDHLSPAERQNLPLAGLPVAVKDLIPAAGFRHTQGSLIFAERVASQDHVIVQRMKQAGAIVVAKSNTPEFGLGSHTFNGVTGLTRNPYSLEHSAGGSSGGAAAALASRMLPIADGSDTGGSLRNPASFCNVVGLRPSLGTVPNSPNGFAFGTLSVKGPMARTVRDAAHLLASMVGFSITDPYSYAADASVLHEVAQSAQGSMMGDSHITAACTLDFSGMYPVSNEVRSIFESAISQLNASDFRVVNSHPELPVAKDSFRVLRGLQMLATLGPLATEHSEHMKNDALWNVQAGREVTGEDAASAMRSQAQTWSSMAEFLEKVDVLITPTVQVPPFDARLRYPREIDGTQMSDYLDWMTLPSIITASNHPAISVPVGFTSAGLPVGIQLVGRFRDEARLLEIAKRVEDRIGSWSITPTIDTATTLDRFPDIR
ncbi:amidase family protein [Brevibacterium sp. ZH18]|uniref:amidase n=1 Tax=Brevibacterium sp. ZH18 TaxID=2927784 RepID=UPI001F61AB3F|nr:amidase family protein [Brevibacterium sp. ZH18]MCI4011119.1 amidase family protein [Brevibacterium sp. ZH18]